VGHSRRARQAQQPATTMGCACFVTAKGRAALGPPRVKEGDNKEPPVRRKETMLEQESVGSFGTRLLEDQGRGIGGGGRALTCRAVGAMSRGLVGGQEGRACLRDTPMALRPLAAPTFLVQKIRPIG
jgi:hypothetical protein